MVSYYRPELGLPEMGLVGRQLWAQSGLTPADTQIATELKAVMTVVIEKVVKEAPGMPPFAKHRI